MLQPNEIKELEESMKREGEKIFEDKKGAAPTKEENGSAMENIAEKVSAFDEIDPFKRLAFYGFVKRTTTDRCIDIKFTKDGTLFGVQSAGKVIEFFNVNNEEEIKKKQKRRQKRQREKAKKKAEETGESVEEEPFVPKPSDEYISKQVCALFLHS